MDRADLEVPLFTGGVSDTHFFNGRLLAAEDLTLVQAAARTRALRLGRAIGDGVASGLEVEWTAPAAKVVVRAGVAVNRNGVVLVLPEDQEVALVPAADDASAAEGDFDDCGPGSGSSTGPAGAGVYLLTIRPARGYEGSVEMRTVDRDARRAGCGSRHVVEGVMFRQVPIGAPWASSPLFGGVAAKPLRLQNLLAHGCLGTPVGVGYRESPPPAHGLIESARDGLITACDVPLALVNWNEHAVAFVDMWAARRDPARADVADPFSVHGSGPRISEGRAMFLQFQAQLRGLTGATAAMLEARDRFRFLPAAGYLPLGTQRFNPAKFFAGCVTSEETIDGAFARSIIHDSFFVEPIDLDNPPAVRILRIKSDGSYILFARDGRGAPPADPPPPPPAKGGLRVTVIESSLQVAMRIGFPSQPQIQQIQVLAVAGSRTILPDRQSSATEFRGGTFVSKLIFDFPPLDPGHYTVRVLVIGRSPIDRGVDVVSDQQKQVTVDLSIVADEPHGPIGPLPEVWPPKYPWTDGPWGKVAPIPDKTLYGVSDEWRDLGPLVNPVPDDMAAKMGPLIAYIRDQYPGAVIDTSDIRMQIAPGHVPGTLESDPYAYIEFGAGGMAVPVLLVPRSESLETKMPPTKAGLKGLSASDEDRLARAGIGDIDTLGAAWTGLVVETLGASLTTATLVVGESKELAVKALGSSLLLPGIDATAYAAIAAAGLDSLVAVANQGATDLAAVAGVSLATASLWLDAARSAVPKTEWSLDDPSLSLSRHDREMLKADDIGSKGQLKAKRQELLGKPGLPAETKARIESAADTITVKDKAAVQKETQETMMKTRLADSGLPSETVSKLEAGGMKTVEDAMKADTRKLAAVLGVDPNKSIGILYTLRANMGLRQ